MNYKMRIDPNYDPVIQFRHFPHSLLSIEEGLGINSMSTKSGKVYRKEFYISEIQGILYGRSVDITEKLHFLGVCENIYGIRRKFQGVSFSSAFRENIEVSFLDLTTNSNPLQTKINVEGSYRDYEGNSLDSRVIEHIMEKDDPSHMYHILSYLQDKREEIERINTIVSKNSQNLEVHFCNLTMSKVQLKNKKKSSLQQRSTLDLRVITNDY